MLGICAKFSTKNIREYSQTFIKLIAMMFHPKVNLFVYLSRFFRLCFVKLLSRKLEVQHQDGAR